MLTLALLINWDAIENKYKDVVNSPVTDQHSTPTYPNQHHLKFFKYLFMCAKKSYYLRNCTSIIQCIEFGLTFKDSATPIQLWIIKIVKQKDSETHMTLYLCCNICTSTTYNTST